MLLNESYKPHGQRIGGTGCRTTVSAGELSSHQTGGGSFNLGNPEKLGGIFGANHTHGITRATRRGDQQLVRLVDMAEKS